MTSRIIKNFWKSSMKKDVEESIFADEDEIALVAEIEDLGLDQYDATK